MTEDYEYFESERYKDVVNQIVTEKRLKRIRDASLRALKEKLRTPLETFNESAEMLTDESAEEIRAEVVKQIENAKKILTEQG